MTEAAAAPILAHMRHLREAKLCTSGMRAWFDLHGFDTLDFIRHGIDVTKLEATGDYFALQVAALARAEAAKHG